MIKKLFFLIILFKFPLFSDELWEKTLKIIEETDLYYPETMEIESIMTTMEGEVKNSFYIKYINSLEAEGKLKSEPVKVIRDGKDITKEYIEDLKKEEKKEKKKEKEEEKSYSSSDFDIFNKKNQKNLKIVRKTVEKIEGRDYVLYDFILKIDHKNNLKGSVWIDLENAKPLKVISTTDPLPKYTKELKTSLYYMEENGKVFLKKMEVEGWGSFLFYKRKFKMKTLFENYLPSNK